MALLSNSSEPLPPAPSPNRRGGVAAPPLPPAPSPKRRGGAEHVFLPLSVSGREGAPPAGNRCGGRGLATVLTPSRRQRRRQTAGRRSPTPTGTVPGPTGPDSLLLPPTSCSA